MRELDKYWSSGCRSRGTRGTGAWWRLGHKNGVFGCLSYPKFQGSFGRDLNLGSGARIPPNPRLSVYHNQLPDTRQRELILCMFVGQLSEAVQHGLGNFLFNAGFLSDGVDDLRFCECHNVLQFLDSASGSYDPHSTAIREMAAGRQAESNHERSLEIRRQKQFLPTALHWSPTATDPNAGTESPGSHIIAGVTSGARFCRRRWRRHIGRAH